MVRRPYKLADELFSHYFGWVVAAVALVPVGILTVILAVGLVSLDEANMYVDSAVKILVAGVGAAWALNRYFIGRVDVKQIRVDAELQLVPQAGQGGGNSKALLTCQVEVTNTGKTKLDEYTLEVEVAQVSIDQTTSGTHLSRLGGLATHPGPVIEPGSWASISLPLVVDSDVDVVRVLLEIEPKSGTGWSWHRMYHLSRAASASATASAPPRG
jgi:hypothetical protein